MVAILRSYGVCQQLVEIIEDLYAGTWCHVRTTDGTSQDFEVKTGVKQGCVLSPILFNCFMDRILKEVAGTLGGGLQVAYTTACWRLVPHLYTALRPKLQHSSKMYCMPMTWHWLQKQEVSSSTCWMHWMGHVVIGAWPSMGRRPKYSQLETTRKQQIRHLSPSRTVHWKMWQLSHT